jgi:solute carrier family 45 protein 1/2/4
MEEVRPSEARVVSSLEIEDGVARSGKAYEPTLLLPQKKRSLLRMFLACMVSGGIQYGWALQLSLLSPYAQVRPIDEILYAS